MKFPALFALLLVLAWPGNSNAITKDVPDSTLAVETARTDSLGEQAAVDPPRIALLIPLTGAADSLRLDWWPLHLGHVLDDLGVGVMRHGGPAQPCVVLEPGEISHVWIGVPWNALGELGGDVSGVLPTSCATIYVAMSPGVGGGRQTVGLRPWLDPIQSPGTRFQMLGGPHGDRTYGLSFGTGVTSTIHSLFAFAFRDGNGARTNSDYSLKQYDWRLDLNPPLLGPCRLLSHYGRISRGMPGPHPSYWVDFPDSSDPRSPRFWALDQGHGAADVMWAEAREELSTRLLALQLASTISGRFPLHAAIVRDEALLNRLAPIPMIRNGDPQLFKAAGDLAARRSALLIRHTLKETELDSLWAVFSVELVRRDAEIEWTTADSSWSESWEEDVRALDVGLGMTMAETEATASIRRCKGSDRVAWGIKTGRKFGRFFLQAGGQQSWDERRLEDIWRWQTGGGDEPPAYRGRFGSVWFSSAWAFSSGTIELEACHGFGSNVWGWSYADTLPAGVHVMWGPSHPSSHGGSLRAGFSPINWLEVDAELKYLPWRASEHHMPGWPDLSMRCDVAFDLPIGTRAHPKAGLRARYAGPRYWGEHETLEVDEYLVFDGWMAVAIGDFTLLILGENLSSGDFQEVLGYPAMGRNLEIGFHWRFWD